MKNKLKKIYVFILSLFTSFLLLSFAFAKSIAGAGYKPAEKSVLKEKEIPVLTTGLGASIYDSLKLNISGLSKQAYDYAMKGVLELKAQGTLLNDSIITIIDFDQPSNNKRLYILDIKHYQLLFNTWVAHGKNSGKDWARSFSNTLSSLKSSPGFYITGSTYMGENGYSLKLQGIEAGINDKAMRRAIVMHGANYVSQSYINAQGCIGRSWGCPAVSSSEAYPIINTIKNGTCLFIYAPDKRYLSHSSILNSRS